MSRHTATTGHFSFADKILIVFSVVVWIVAAALAIDYQYGASDPCKTDTLRLVDCE
jgi:hypothetical protein